MKYLGNTIPSQLVQYNPDLYLGPVAEPGSSSPGLVGIYSVDANEPRPAGPFVLIRTYLENTREADRCDAVAVMTVAERLQRLLAKYDVSVNSVAEMAGMERMQVYRIVQGKTPNPGILTVERIVEAAGGTMRELYEDNG